MWSIMKEVQGLTIVSGADSLRFRSLLQLAGSIRAHEGQSRFLIYDLGLTPGEGAKVMDSFPEALVRKFDFAAYPPHVHIRVEAGAYAWKPIIFSSVLEETRGMVLWLDAGCIVVEPLTMIRRLLIEYGFYSPFSHGDIEQWTHAKTLHYLKVDRELYECRNLSGGIVGVHYRFSEVVDTIRQWKELALVRECIAPEGSDRSNHRQDQALLSVIAHQNGLLHSKNMKLHGLLKHQNIDKTSSVNGGAP
jgi:hypothetical protein